MVGISLILSPTNSVVMSIKEKFDISKTLVPSTYYSSIHCCISSSNVVVCRGSSRTYGGITVKLLLHSCFVTLASWVLLLKGRLSYLSSSASSSSSFGIGSGIYGKGITFLITFCLLFTRFLIFLLFGAKGEACSSC